MRRLIRVPIIHTSVDMGSLSEAVRTHYVKTFGPEVWSQREQVVAGLWNAIQERIWILNVEYGRVRIYQDGLPVCGFEEAIVRELAQAGSCNHQLILELLDKGATLMGTEDPQLLMREYQIQQRQAVCEGQTDQPWAEEAARLLERRDRFIAARIDETLQAGETGVLFLGAAHRLDMGRSGDVRVEDLLTPA
jgi:hypothetical protein